MPPSIRFIVTVKRDEGPCEQCPQVIPKGTIHATAIQTFGKSQAGKVKYKTSHLHMTCVTAFIIADHLQYATRTKKVRGKAVPKEHHEKRNKLIRTRARLLRCILAATTPEAIAHYKDRIVVINHQLAECGGLPRQSMMRRDPATKAVLDRKLGVMTSEGPAFTRP